MSDKNFAIIENEETSALNQYDENVETEQVADAEQSVETKKKKLDKAFPISKRTKGDQSKTSVVYSVLSVVLYVLAYLPILIVSLVLAIKCYKLVPYYSFWPFVGVIIAGVFGLIFMTITLIVARKNSKRSVRSQTVRTLIAFVCLTCVFGLILTYVFPDVIAFATQNTLYCEDLYYNGASQAEKNAKLERDFFMYNVLNGNLNEFGVNESTGALEIYEHGDFAYANLVKHPEGTSEGFQNEDIKIFVETWEAYGSVESLDAAIALIKESEPRRAELYEFIYKYYVLNDYDYAFNNSVQRRAVGLAVTDYIYKYFNTEKGGYEGLLKEGFNNPRVKKLFIDNYNSFNQDGYLAFDDPLLLYAQVGGTYTSRMTIPVVLRLILNKGWTYTQPGVGSDGKYYYGEDGNFLYQLYDKELVDAYIATKSGETREEMFPYEGKIVDQNNQEITVRYAFNDDGWMLFENGYTRRPIKWLVLDMLGDPMQLADLPDDTVNMVIGALEKIGAMDAVGGLVQEDLADVIKAATNGSSLSIGLCVNDNDALEINLYSMNAPYGMLGYMQATWVDSDNLLMAVINVVSLRNWFCVLGAVGVLMIIAAGVCRDMGEKTRKRTEDSRDRIILSQTIGEATDDAVDNDDMIASDEVAEQEIAPAN